MAANSPDAAKRQDFLMTKAGTFTAKAVENLVKDKETLAKAYEQLLASNKRLRAKLRSEGRYV